MVRPTFCDSVVRAVSPVQVCCPWGQDHGETLGVAFQSEGPAQTVSACQGYWKTHTEYYTRRFLYSYPKYCSLLSVWHSDWVGATHSWVGVVSWNVIIYTVNHPNGFTGLPGQLRLKHLAGPVVVLGDLKLLENISSAAVILQKAKSKKKYLLSGTICLLIRPFYVGAFYLFSSFFCPKIS